MNNHDGLEGMRSETCWHLCAYKPDDDMSLERNISAIRRFMHKRSDLKGFCSKFRTCNINIYGLHNLVIIRSFYQKMTMLFEEILCYYIN